ncbi:MAG TPA: trehalose-6-phosphate synthase [bacterium]|jgi:alpha,alpha-trehalose-phosphate synthase [UDP-forming]|nr:trehalose-6-phosphate synthase [bacterium]
MTDTLTDPLDKTLKKIASAGARAAAKVLRADAFDGLAGREQLVELVAKKLKNRRLLLVSNREPYMHVRRGDAVECIRPAGGLTIALDSMASACQATWICQGGGDADFEVTDERGRVKVPPNRPTYWLRRLRIDAAEEKGFYEGFCNATLWPLCHVCYVRPKFDSSDWELYQAVNRRFADAVLEEAEPGSIVFLQDYHLALVARYLKRARPDLTTVLFWHIPWPNPEIFRILPWKKELLDGMLANDVVGFHLPYHAQNFLQTVDQELECQIDREHQRVLRGDEACSVRDYPISVDFRAVFEQAERDETRRAAAALRGTYALEGLKVGLGVDRLDYTKGIPERLQAVERLLERHPEYLGRFTFVQIGVPSRMGLEDYQQVVAEIEERCAALNARFARGGWRPVILLKGHQDFDTLIPFYQLADLCVVSSLHDGMNLVAKEFVAASSNDRGVLVLSRFTGAARELEQALLVNPFDVDALAEAMHQALVMPPEEQKVRLGRLRERVAQNNIFNWATSILKDVVQLAEDSAVPAS